MLSPSIQGLHIKFQPNQLKNAKVMHVFHFQAGRLVGWQASLAGQHAKIFINQIQMQSLSIQRLHTKFQPDWLKILIYARFSFLGWQAGWVVARFGWLACLNLYKSNSYVESFHSETKYKVSTKSIEKCQSYARFLILGQQAGWVVGWFSRLAC